MQVRVKLLAEEEDIGITRKSISLSDSVIETPTKLVRPEITGAQPSGTVGYEHAKNISDATLLGLHTDSEFKAKFLRDIKHVKVDPKPQLIHFNLVTPSLPPVDYTKTLAHTLYSVSGSFVCLPSVRSSIFKSENPVNRTSKFNPKSMENYLTFQKTVIDAIKLRNNKTILGIIPLNLPPLLLNPIIDFYYNQEIFHFVIDGNTSSIMNNETNLRSILDRIKQNSTQAGGSLSTTYIHATNLGLEQFKANDLPADDLLSLFMYIDSFGITFKTRGRSNKNNSGGPKIIAPRKKLFSREQYVYRILHNDPTEYTVLRKKNDLAQLEETKFLKDIVGEGEVGKYLQTKDGAAGPRYKKILNIKSIIKSEK